MNGGFCSYIYYGMDKYSGCNKVESVVSAAPKANVKRLNGRATVIRVIVSCVIIGAILLVAFAPIDFLIPVRDALRSVFCYDMFGRSDIGSIPIITKMTGQGA